MAPAGARATPAAQAAAPAAVVENALLAKADAPALDPWIWRSKVALRRAPVAKVAGGVER